MRKHPLIPLAVSLAACGPSDTHECEQKLTSTNEISPLQLILESLDTESDDQNGEKVDLFEVEAEMDGPTDLSVDALVIPTDRQGNAWYADSVRMSKNDNGSPELLISAGAEASEGPVQLWVFEKGTEEACAVKVTWRENGERKDYLELN